MSRESSDHTAPADRRQTPRQTTGAVLMIRPQTFFSNPETALTNEFQRPENKDTQDRAMVEFEGLARTLRDNGIEVVVFDDTPDPVTPDAVFPNNWMSTHADGTVVTYPMQPVSRRGERRDDIVANLSRLFHFKVRRLLNLSRFEERDQYLEGTGSLVLDRANRVAYACLSARTHAKVLAEFARELGYEIVAFHAYGASGQPVYHTNVLMCIGRKSTVICLDAIDAAERDAVAARLSATHEVVPITLEQMHAFAGNMLELTNVAGESLLFMSARARASLSDAQAEALGRHARLVNAPISAIEDAAGGSVRCMLAEIFLDKAEDRAGASDPNTPPEPSALP